MNIFVTNKSPTICAKILDDKRVVKMTLETCQLLSTAMHEINIPSAPYRKTHHNHPCAKFTRATAVNFKWVLSYFEALCHEYTYRYNKSHACEKFIPIFRSAVPFFPEGSLTQFVNCTLFKDIKSVYSAYKKMLCLKWSADKRKPTWRKRKCPTWWVNQ